MRKFSILSVILLVGLFFPSNPVMAGEPDRGGTLVIGIPDDPDRLDGHRIHGAMGYWLTTGTLYNSLVTGGEKNDVVPNLAQSWEKKEGGKVWDFNLHQGVKFHDGSELTAEVVKWNYERALEAKVGWADRGDFIKLVERMEAVDKYTVRFYLKRPSQIFHIAPLSIIGQGLPMVSRQAVEKWGFKDFDSHAVGTGPFKLVEWQRDDRIIMVRNDNYFKKGLPYFDKVIFRIIKDPNTRFSALRAGEIHIMFDLPPEMVPMIQKTSGVTYLKSQPCSYVWLLLNCDPEAEKVGSAFFKDVRVRQAISMAIDRDELARLVVPGAGEPAYGGPLPIGHPFYHKVDWVKYDPGQAKKLLQEAGYPNLKFTMETNNSKARFVRALEVIKEQLSRIGVETDIKVYEKAGHYPRLLVKPGLYHAYLEDYEFSLDASTYLARYLPTGAGQNRNRYSNKEFDELLEEGLVEGDFQKRKKLYDRAQEIVVKECPLIHLWYGIEDMAINSKLKGYLFTPYLTAMKFEKAYLEK